MSDVHETSDQRDDKADDLATERVGKAGALAKDLRHFKWETRGLYVIAIICVAATLVLYPRVSKVVDQIQTERERNTLEFCNRESRQNAAIRHFVTESIPAKRMTPEIRAYLDGKKFSKAQIAASEALSYLERLRTTFPDRDCKAEVRRHVKGTRP